MPSRFLATLLLALLAAASAGAAPPAGRWKFRLPEGDESITFLLNFAEQGGAWKGEFLSSSVGLRKPPSVPRVEVEGDRVRFAVEIDGRAFIDFDGKLSADKSRVPGCFSVFGGQLQLTELYPSQLTKVDDPIELARENLAQLPPGPDFFNAGFLVLSQAELQKSPEGAVLALCEKLNAAATGYGTRWEGSIAYRTAAVLADQAPYAAVALAQAQKAEAALDAKRAPPGEQLATVELLQKLYAAAKKPDDAAKLAGRLGALREAEFAEHERAGPGYAVTKYAGRKPGGTRVALVEVFTGAECPPCVGVDLATDGLLQAYAPSEVVVLNYHIHVPAPDPLTSPDGVSRLEEYGKQVSGAPTVFLNGKPGPDGGGPASEAASKHAAYRKLIDPILEQPAPVELTLTSAPTPAGFSATAKLKRPDAKAKLTLRFALAESVVRYPGGNGVKFHARVVRSQPGGPKGFPVAGATAEQTVAIDVGALRASLADYLAKFPKAESAEFPRAERPLDLAKLRLVAFAVDDATGEVLQAAEVELGKQSVK